MIASPTPVMLFAVHPLATTNAVLNTLATVLLVAGWAFIRRGNWKAHRDNSFAISKTTTTFAEKAQVFNGNKKHSATKYQTNYSLLNYKTRGLVKLKINL
ncbi:MAG: hypothetical protein ACKOYJ_04590, partial [Planctomycetia bacterium]